MTTANESGETVSFSARFPWRAMYALVLFFTLIGTLSSVIVGVRSGQWLLAILALPVMAGGMWLFWFLHFRLLVMSGPRGRLRLHIGPEGICREHWGRRFLVPWERVTRVRLRPPHWFNDDAVEVYTAEGLALEINEFNRVGDIAQAIESRLAYGVAMERELN